MLTSILNNLSIDSRLEKKTSVKFDSENDLLMYYHTTIRNIGLFTSIAFAALSTARVGQYNSPKSTFFVKIILLFSFAFFFMALLMNQILIRNVSQQMKFRGKNNEILFIPYGIFVLNLILVFVCLGMALNII